MIVECASCGGRFTAKRKTAKYCSPRCRMRASRAPEAPPARRDTSAPVFALAPDPAPESEGGFAADTRRELEAAGRLDTFRGRSAMYLARIVDAAPADTLGGHAAIMRQYEATMEKALDGAQVSKSLVEQLREEQQRRTGAA